MAKNGILYYYHSLESNKENNTNTGEKKDSPIIVKVLDENDKDIMLNILGIPPENDLLKFAVHIYIAK